LKDWIEKIHSVVSAEKGKASAKTWRTNPNSG